MITSAFEKLLNNAVNLLVAWCVHLAVRSVCDCAAIGTSRDSTLVPANPATKGDKLQGC